MLLSAVSVLLAACASTPSANAKLFLTPLPASQTHCDGPVSLPARALTQLEVETYWAEDRKSLVTCRSQLNGVVTHYETLSRNLVSAGS